MIANNSLLMKNSSLGIHYCIPRTFFDTIRSRETEASLEEILKGFNN